MNCDKVKLLINEYFDGELKKNIEPEIFTHIALCSECRNYFNSFNFIKKQTANAHEPFSYNLEKSVFESIKNTNRKKPFKLTDILSYKIPALATFSFATIIIIMFSAIYALKIDKYNTEIIRASARVERTKAKLEKQNEILEAMYNSMSPIEIIGIKNSNKECKIKTKTQRIMKEL